MLYTIAKVAITALLIVLVSEVSKRNTAIGALLVSLPLMSIMAMTWLYLDTKDVTKVAQLSLGILWLTLPGTAFFVALPMLLKHGVEFYLSMAAAMLITAGCYFLTLLIFARFGIQL